MDLKTKLIDNILLDMQGQLASEQLSILRGSLAFNLHKYEIVEIEESKELPSTVNENNRNALARFLLAKSIEGKSEGTIHAYKYRLEQFLGHLTKSLQEVNTEDIRLYLTYIKQTTHCSNTTLENVRLCLSSFFGWCHNEDIISRNPMFRIAKIKKDTYKEKPFSQQEKVEKLLKRYHVDNVSSNISEDVREIALDLAGNKAIEVGTLLQGNAVDSTKLAYMSALMKQNWIIIRLLDELAHK